MFSVVTIDEAKKIIEDNFKYKLDSELVDIKSSLGRIASKDITSSFNVPGFRRSSVDGYAVRAADIRGASEAIPSFLTLVGEVEMGKEPNVKLESTGECMYIPTGGMLPIGADSVIMIEYTDKMDEVTILAVDTVAVGDNVVAEDEDIKIGEKVINKGTKIRPYEVGVLSSIGCTEIEVFKKLRVGIISSGDEVVSPYDSPQKGQVRDINTYLLYTLILESIAEPAIYGVARDEYDELFEVIQLALNECDIVLISGGSSVGAKDYTAKILNSLNNSKVLIHGLAIKPGKPTIVANCDGKIAFGMPGHPLACAIVYKSLVSFYIDYITGNHHEKFSMDCRFSLNYHKAKGREEYIPVEIEIDKEGIIAKPIFGKSGIITTFSKAGGYIRAEKDKEGIMEGEIVKVYEF